MSPYRSLSPHHQERSDEEASRNRNPSGSARDRLVLRPSVIIASGALATTTGSLLREWPLTLFGLLALAYGAAQWRRRIRAIRRKAGNP
jgi:uncharacterized membrane protein YidH (DUF202 family)